MKLKKQNVVCTHWLYLSGQYSRMYCTYDFLGYCTYDYIALTRQNDWKCTVCLGKSLSNHIPQIFDENRSDNILGMNQGRDIVD